ncbi:MAG: TIGR04255 family protein [Burkholderiales bacterium]|nr:TIGR04255 family protein [Burkholderiales bacterium]
MAVNFPKLPDFERPPVVEVVLSLQFEALPKLQVQHIGQLWDRFKTDFPVVETKPPLDPVLEMFDRKPARPMVQFSVGEMPMFPRVWFVSGTGSEIIQVQSDRIIHNWRKTGTSPEYPRYDRIREDFKKSLKKVTDFLRDNALGELRPNQCEVSYINHVPISDSGAADHGEPHRLLKIFNKDFGIPFLPTPEAVNFSTRYLLQHADINSGKPFGRLYVDLKPAYSENQTSIFVINLTVRSAPSRNDIESAMECYDIGRKYIVCTFDAMTEDGMHKVWGKMNER